MVAEDKAKNRANAFIPVRVVNTNDKPMIDINGELIVRNLFRSIESEETALLESQSLVLPHTSLFRDDDLSLGDLVNEELSIEIETRDGRKIEGLELESTINGDIQLTLSPLKGITSYIKHELRMSAGDKYDETNIHRLVHCRI